MRKLENRSYSARSSVLKSGITLHFVCSLFQSV